MMLRTSGTINVKRFSIAIACIVLLAGAVKSLAQVPLQLPTDHEGIVAMNALQLKQEMEFRKSIRTDDTGQILGALPDVIRKDYAAMETKGGVSNIAHAFGDYLKKNPSEIKMVEARLEEVQVALKAAVPSFYRGIFDEEMARILLQQDVDLPAAEGLAQSGVALFDRGDCLQDDRFGAESHHVYDEAKAKHPVPFTYHAEEGDEHCAQSLAARYATLGKIQAKRGNVDEAAKSFDKALKAHANADAALGVAPIDGAKGDEAGELEMYEVASLTGALSPEDVKSARALYAKLNPGSEASDYDALLDARYARTFANPVVDRDAKVPPQSPQKVVLEELFTVADCEPCVSPDLATEAVLKHYGREQVVVAVYHDNAPGPDPLTTATSEARAKYYGTGDSTPHVMVDGKEIEIEEGPPSHAQSSFEIMTKAIDPLLATSGKASLRVVPQMDGDLVHVTVSGDANSLPAKTRLEILLVETEVSDTGKNTLRFQQMVVRAAAAAKAGELGLPVNSQTSISANYTFNLKQVEADHLKYYDDYREGFEKRMSAFIDKGYFTRAEIDKMAQFREPRNLVHSDRLAVIAFLQSEETKEVTQSSYAAVAALQDGGRK